jgi:hypothetical protein
LEGCPSVGRPLILVLALVMWLSIY